ncbi:hypothetical protein F3K20_08560 [Streptomyces scabiei]|nr:hypothetical protein [Streptomyces sp. LBUM 1484]MBP5874620.1 hypothetical protein [Streptomyces sp. LBUM 1477]MBP5882370.1 hypothetical protein [Streptomyces sp. LBUM 1487]MBP5894750.1 hypothetical protein [Streptomyces sp. LBUM 1481]MBP5898434.1 hypothetical protein [Streptomyces sp. LBUM 1488]MBP5925022.1 hypothetical protein [Streptomyces sp. LBUM 1483]QTU44873.1 hypothetical protein F3K20_08560 [Streptomyces sp. LBUM 1482]QTU61006.1 hypothetical protein F3K22_08340 [Streptomyces sp. 
MLGFSRAVVRDGCLRGGASASREVRRCSRIEISPHRRRGPRTPELSSHHAAEPGVDTNGVVRTECLGAAFANRDTRACRTALNDGIGHVPGARRAPRGVVNVTAGKGFPGRGIQSCGTHRIPRPGHCS